MLKNQSTYEIMTPESVGVHKTSLVMGKHSGRVDQGLDVLVVDVLLAVGERLEPLEGVLELVVGQHPPGRDAEEPVDLRDHDAGIGRRAQDLAGDGQAPGKWVAPATSFEARTSWVVSMPVV
jgi:hypothetical protein